MANVIVDWVEPTKRKDGSVLLPADIEGTEVSLGTNGTFTVLAKVTPAQPKTLTRAMPDGSYVMRFVVIDKAGRRGDNFDHPFTVKTVAAPGTVSGVKIVIS